MCYDGTRFIAWPDGKSLLEQEECLIVCFRVIKNELYGMLKDVK